jgi:DNA-directed RNA polymerase alpha subunit
VNSTTGSESSSDDFDKSIAELNLGTRAKKAADALGCTTIGALSNRSASEFKKLKNCGATTIAEIREKLEARGLSLLPD